MPGLWDQIFAANGVVPQETPVTVADSPATKDRDREQLVEILFEKYKIPSYFAANQGVLSLYSCGRTSGLVVDLGYGSTTTMAIHEGFAFPHTIERQEIGGYDIALCLESMLQDRGVNTSVLDMDVMQEELSIVAHDFTQEAGYLLAHPDERPSVTLPDGSTVILQDEPLRCGEALFEPGLVGVAGPGLGARLWNVVHACDTDKDGGSMRNLPQCVILTGGLSQMPGLPARTRAELERRCGSSTRGFFVTALPGDEARHAPWLGASLLASLPGFIANNFVSSAEYAEFGAPAVHRRC
jgi:actin, other eukaryote